MDKINKGFIYFICCVSALGGLLFGYDWVVIGGAKPFYEVYFGIWDDPVQQGWAMSIAIIGCLIGAMTAGALADRMGRRNLLISSAFVFLMSAYATGAFNNYEWFLAARFLGGIGIGIASGLSPMYIAEVSPSDVRGRMVSINQLTIVLGILGAQIANWLLAEPIPEGLDYPPLDSWNCQWGWRWMFWAEAFPAALFFLMAFFIPESPRWLSMNGRREEAKAILIKVGGDSYAGSEMLALKKSLDDEVHRKGLGTLFSRRYAGVLTLGIIVAIFQQWCGTNVIFNYAQEIFANAGFALSDMLFNIVLTGITNVVFTFVAIFTVDRIGRRTLMLIGAWGLALIYSVIGACYFFEVHGAIMMVLVVAAIACYAMTLGPVTWVLLSEIFPNKVRGVAVATCTFALWAACFVLTYTFPILNASLGSYGTFWVYALTCYAGAVYFIFRMPETKGLSLEEIERQI